MNQINLRGITAKSRRNADHIMATERRATREQGSYLATATAGALVRRGIAEWVMFDGHRTGAVRPTAAWMAFNAERAHLLADEIDPFTSEADVKHRVAALRFAIEHSPSTVSDAQRAEVARADAREASDNCSRHGLSRYPSCPRCDAAENADRIDRELDAKAPERRAQYEQVQGELKSRRGLAPDQLAYLGASKSKRIDMWNVSSVERRGYFMAAEIRVANDEDAAYRECRVCGSTEFATGGDNRCDRCVTKAMILAEEAEADAMWNAPNVVKLAAGASLEDVARAMGLELAAGDLDGHPADRKCGDWSCPTCGTPDLADNTAETMGSALVERCARLGHDHVIEGHSRPRLEAIATATICYARNFAGLRVSIADDGEWFPGTVDVMMWSGDGMVVRADDQPDSPVRVPLDRIRFAVPVAVTKTGHADYPHEPGTLYDCPACGADCFCGGRDECVRCAVAAEVSS